MRKFLKWIGISLATVVGAILVLVAVLVFLGGRKLSATRTVAVDAVAVPADAGGRRARRPSRADTLYVLPRRRPGRQEVHRRRRFHGA